MKLSVAMIASNEATNLARSLPSVAFADEIVVVENDSTDATVEVARRSGATVVSQPWLGYAKQRNTSINHCHGDWVLILDADEVISPALAQEIKMAIQDSTVDGFMIAYRNIVAGRALNHGGWYPDWHLRLVRRNKAVFEQKAIHESIEGLSAIGYLKEPIVHYTYASFHQWLEKVNRYTDLEAPKRSFKWSRFFLKPTATFLRSYFWWSGYRDGALGLIASLIGAWYVLLTEIKRYEIKHAHRT